VWASETIEFHVKRDAALLTYVCQICYWLRNMASIFPLFAMLMSAENFINADRYCSQTRKQGQVLPSCFTQFSGSIDSQRPCSQQSKANLIRSTHWDEAYSVYGLLRSRGYNAWLSLPRYSCNYSLVMLFRTRKSKITVCIQMSLLY
jgi:hypothetical protein